jgi:hypothetical protein
MNHRLLATKQQQQQQPQDQPPQEFNPSSTIIPSTTTLTAALSHSPPPVVYLKNVCAWNVETLKELHLALFPVHYSDTFYQQVQNVGEFAKVGTYSIHSYLSMLTLLVFFLYSVP